MAYKIYEELFSGHRLRYAFQYSGTELYMYPYIKKSQAEGYDILASPEYIEMHKIYYTESRDDRYIEYKSLIGLTSLALLPYDSLIMHAVAVLLDGYCLLITAPPGTGKTTQYNNLKSLYGNDIEMICGDMPLIEIAEQSNIMVHPSPWNGKERIKGRRSAPLGGVIYLRQGNENTLRRMSPEEYVFPLLSQLAILPDTEEQIVKMTSIADHLFKQCPIWEMVNCGDKESSRMAAETFRAYVKDKAHEI